MMQYKQIVKRSIFGDLRKQTCIYSEVVMYFTM